MDLASSAAISPSSGNSPTILCGEHLSSLSVFIIGETEPHLTHPIPSCRLHQPKPSVVVNVLGCPCDLSWVDESQPQDFAVTWWKWGLPSAVGAEWMEYKSEVAPGFLCESLLNSEG